MRLERVVPVALLVLAALLARVPASAVQATLESSRDQAPRLSGDGTAQRLEDTTLGLSVLVPQRPRRIVSLTLASDVMLAALVAPDRVAAVTSLVDDPSYSSAAGHYPEAVPRITASAELLLSLEPDLVVVSGYSHPATARALVGAGVPVLRLPSGRSLDEVREAFVLLARALGETDRAEAGLAQFDAARAALEASPAPRRPRGLFLAAGGFTHGVGTLTDELLALGGVENLARDAGLVGLTHVGVEWVAASRPELLIVPAADEAQARATLAWIAPGLADVLAPVPVIALPPRLIESTSPECIEAAVRLREAVTRPSR